MRRKGWPLQHGKNSEQNRNQVSRILKGLGIEDVKGIQSFNEGLPVEGTPPKPKILQKIQCGQKCETASSRATSETLEFWNLGTLVLCNLEPCV